MRSTPTPRRIAARASFAMAATAAVLLTSCGSGGDGEYPDGQIEYIVPYNPGGSADPAGREFADLLADELGTSATVENLPGGDETIGVASAVTAEPDGMRMSLTSATGIIVQPMISELDYESPEEITAIVKMLEAPNALVVGNNSPYESLEDLIQDAEDRPGELRIGTTGRVSNNSFAIAMLEEAAGIEVTIVPFSGGAGEAVLATMSGEIDAAMPTAAGQLGLLESEDLRALAHTGSSEYDAVLGAPSFESLDIDIPYASSDYFTVTAPDVAEDAEATLMDAALTVAESEEWREFCEANGFIADPMQGEELDQWIEQAVESAERGIELMDSRDGAEEEQ